jgi:hypothetical protein
MQVRGRRLEHRARKTPLDETAEAYLLTIRVGSLYQRIRSCTKNMGNNLALH